MFVCYGFVLQVKLEMWIIEQIICFSPCLWEWGLSTYAIKGKTLSLTLMYPPLFSYLIFLSFFQTYCRGDEDDARLECPFRRGAV